MNNNWGWPKKYPRQRVHLKYESRVIVHTDVPCRVAVIPLSDFLVNKTHIFGVEGCQHYIECDEPAGEYFILLDREGVSATFTAMHDDKIFEEGTLGPYSPQARF